MWSHKALLCLGLVSTLLTLLSNPFVQAAPCCSAGSSLPALITNDDHAQVSLMNSSNYTIMDAPDQGIPVLRSEQNSDQSWLIRIAGAIKFWESWQIGVGASFIDRSTRISGHEFQANGLGDSDVSIAYEVLPEWNYSQWKPRGWIYFQTVFPTGNSIYDPNLESAASVRGQGVFQSVLGLSLTKALKSWDFLLLPEIRRLFGKSFRESGSRISGTWGGALLLGVGYNFSDWRVGLSIQPIFQESRSILSSGTASTIPQKRVWNTNLSLSYLLNSEWTGSIQYSDQTLMGPARNTTLERGLGILVSRKWEP